MVTIPAATPVTAPAPATVAIAVLLLVQLPPVTDGVRVMLLPAHKVVGPLIVPATGSGFTLSVAVAAQPVGSV